MRKTHILTLCLTVALIYGVAVSIASESDIEDMCVPMGTIIIGPPEGVIPKRAPVEFPHSVHFGYSCTECHHVWEGDDVIMSCMTSGCHDVTMSPTAAAKEVSILKKKPDDAEAVARIEELSEIAEQPEMLYFKKAYHTSCISCHREVSLRNKELEMSKRTIGGKLSGSGPMG